MRSVNFAALLTLSIPITATGQNEVQIQAPAIRAQRVEVGMLIKMPRPQVRKQLVDLTDSFDPVVPGPQSLTDYAKSEIAQLERTVRLAPRQKRILEIAVKGVNHRLRQAQQEKREAARVQQLEVLMVGFGGVPAIHDRTPEFRRQLRTHRLWIRTLDRVLTQAQRQQWNTAIGVPAKPSAEPGTAPPADTIPQER